MFPNEGGKDGDLSQRIIAHLYAIEKKIHLLSVFQLLLSGDDV